MAANDAEFTHANLQDAVLTRADCRGATFTDALLYETVFADTRINSQTTFSNPEDTFYDLLTPRPECVYEADSALGDEPPEGADVHRDSDEWDPAYALAWSLPEGTDRLEAASWVYRRLESLHEENALSGRAREFHISKEEAERERLRDSDRKRWAVKTVMGHLSRHGESVRNVLYSWAVVIGLCAALFPLVGGTEDNDGTVYQLAEPSELLTWSGWTDVIAQLMTLDGWQDVFLNAYFSVITFSTIGYGDLSPHGPYSRALVAVESILGAVLVALLVFVLGRRVAR